MTRTLRIFAWASFIAQVTIIATGVPLSGVAGLSTSGVVARDVPPLVAAPSIHLVNLRLNLRFTLTWSRSMASYGPLSTPGGRKCKIPYTSAAAAAETLSEPTFPSWGNATS